MLVGYVSDENYLALSDVSVEFVLGGNTVATTRSTPRGAINVEIEPGSYRIYLAKTGFGSKWVDVKIGEELLNLRLLSDCLLGYAWPKWVQSNGITTLRVHSPEPYKAELWRYGSKKEFVRILGWFDEHGPRAMTQILPDKDFTIEGTNWNSGGFTTAPAFIYKIKAPERSGLYYVHLTGQSGAFFSFPLVVAPERPTAKIAVVAGTNTWNSYNNFGGRSNYINSACLPPTPTVYSRLDLARYGEARDVMKESNDSYRPLSFDRPDIECHVPLDVELDDPMEGRLRSTLAPGTWRLLGWMERKGYEYDLYSDHQLHEGVLDLDAYQTVVLDVHPEYWSRLSYERLRDWVHGRGGHLMYLGGNGIDCEVEFVGDLAARHLTQQPDRDNAADDIFDNRFHKTGEPSAKLLGVTFTSSGEGTAAPYEVIEQDHWVFEGTGLHNGELFGERTLHERVPGGASGHETDERTPSSPPETLLLAKGINDNGGGAELVYYESDAGGGAVYSVGSITYISALLVDESISTMTCNVFDRFTDEDKDRSAMENIAVSTDESGASL